MKRGAGVILASLLTLACNALQAEPGLCASDGDCAASQICDGELGICRVTDEARRCTPQDTEDACGIFADCSDAVCVEADPIIALINNPLSGDTRTPQQVQHGAAQFAVSEVADAFEQFAGRTPQLVHLVAGFDPASRAGAFAAASDMGADVVLTFDAEVTREAQRFFIDRRTLVLALFTNYSAFGSAESDSLRYTYGLVPEPAADFAMWARFLDQNTACRRVATVYVAGTSDDELTRHIEIQLPKAGLERVPPIALTPGVDPAEAVGRLIQQDVDCAFALPALDEVPEDTFGVFLEAWTSARTGADDDFFWLFHNEKRLEDLREELGSAALAELEGAYTVRYETGGESGEQLTGRFIEYYETEYLTQCPDEPCFAPVTNRQVENNALFVALGYDQAVLGLLATLRALRESRPSRVTLRRSFQAINGDAQDAVDCSASTLELCVEGILQGAAPNYRGASGELRFGDDGRTQTLDQVMIFSRVEAGAATEVARFTHEEMADALQGIR